MANVERLENEFGEIVAENIHREGIDNLMEFLYQSDFFKSPASTKYHGSYEGGLVEHSINVYYSLIDTLQFFYGPDWEERYSKEKTAKTPKYAGKTEFIPIFTKYILTQRMRNVHKIFCFF